MLSTSGGTRGPATTGGELSELKSLQRQRKPDEGAAAKPESVLVALRLAVRYYRTRTGTGNSLPKVALTPPGTNCAGGTNHEQPSRDIRGK